MKVSINEISEILLKKDNFCIYTHISPDGDAVASAFGLAMGLRSLGKKVAVKCIDNFPQKFMKAVGDFVSDELTEETGIAVDASALKRLGDYADADITLCIDHHVTNDCSVQHTYLDEYSISCSAMIFRIFECMGISLSDQIRKLLFMGLVTDSDGFKSAEVSPRVFKDATDITDGLSSVSEIIKDYYTSKTIAEIECEKEMLSSLTFLCNGKLAVATASSEVLARVGKGNTGGLASLPARIEGVELGVSLFQVSDTVYTLSIRSSGTWDASLLAKEFNGGGHKSSAGGKSDGRAIDELLSFIAERVTEIYCK